jgi:hypothetical protein
MLYEYKSLEAYLAEITVIPLAKTYISNDQQDALAMIETFSYPVVSKFETGSGSVGVTLVRNKKQSEKSFRQAFSTRGRMTHRLYQREKDYCYFQEFIPNDGYDIRCILVDNKVFGYSRKTLAGDFRASGMNQVVWGALPEKAILTAWRANKLLKSPILVMDMVHGLDDTYTVIEYSINCQIDTPEQLIVDGVPGMYIIGEDESVRFQPGRVWIHDLALREFFLKNYLPRCLQVLAPQPELFAQPQLP